MPNEVAFQLAPALVSGLIASFIALAAMVLMLAIAPTRFPANPLYLTGSAVSIETTLAYVTGLVFLLAMGAAYGAVVTALITGFEAESLEFIWGGIAGAVLSIVTGTTLAYARSLNRAVRSGQVGDPGPFLFRYGTPSVVQFVLVHILFGAVCGTLYPILS